jgi:uncharacterized protein (TIGR02646 family)
MNNTMVNIDYDVKKFVADGADIDRKLQKKATVIIDKINNGEALEKSDLKRYNSPELREFLKKIFSGNCVYCEREGCEIDHYRPKGKVEEEDEKHSGYYWLSCEITNFLWVCGTCNKAKKAKFPIKGKRVFRHSENQIDQRINSKRLRQEEPLLLNPLIHSPEDHLRVNYSGGIVPVKNSEKGEKTIEVCKLDRETLIHTRKKIIDNFFGRLIKRYNTLRKYSKIPEYKKPSGTNGVKLLYDLTFGDHFSEIEENKERDQNFSRVYHAIYLEFENFLDKYLNNNTDFDADNKTLIKKLLTKAFNMLTQPKTTSLSE